MKLLDRQPSLGPEYSFRAYRWSGLYHLANLEYIASLADFKQALLEANKTKLDSYIIDALRWCAEVEKRMQNFDESEKNLLLALQRAESSKNWLAAIDAALCMGVYKSGRGQIEGAERYYRKALDWSERYYPDKPNPRWTALANYADFHRRLGDTDIAFDTMNSAMTLAEKNKSTRPDLVVQAYISLGGLWSDRGDQTEARKYLAKAKLAYRDESMVDHPLLFRLYEVWAHSYWLERNDAKAVPLYSQAIAQFRLTDSRPSYLILLVDEEIANRNNLRRILGYDGLTHQRLLKIAKLHPNNFSNRNHAASSIKHLSFLCTLDNRPADAANIDKIACEIRDNRKK